MGKTTLQDLNEAGEYAFVAHHTNDSWMPYIKHGGEWYELDGPVNGDFYAPRVSAEDVLDCIIYEDFELVYEGVRQWN